MLQELKKRKQVESDPHTGKMFAYVYTSEDEKFHSVQAAFDLFELGVDPDKTGGEEEYENLGEEEKKSKCLYS